VASPKPGQLRRTKRSKAHQDVAEDVIPRNLTHPASVSLKHFSPDLRHVSWVARAASASAENLVACILLNQSAITLGGVIKMNFLTKAYIRAREQAAQSMTEYALIMAAVAVVAFAAYTTLGTKIVTLVNGISADL
jgi:Flp pilus assembly pilin Flp